MAELLPPILALPCPGLALPHPQPAQNTLAAQGDFHVGPCRWKTGKGRISGLKGKRDLQVPDWTDSGWRLASSSCCRCCWRCSRHCCWKCCWWSFSFFSVWLSAALWVLLHNGKWTEDQFRGDGQNTALPGGCAWELKKLDSELFPFLLTLHKVKGGSGCFIFSTKCAQPSSLASR